METTREYSFSPADLFPEKEIFYEGVDYPLIYLGRKGPIFIFSFADKDLELGVIADEPRCIVTDFRYYCFKTVDRDKVDNITFSLTVSPFPTYDQTIDSQIMLSMDSETLQSICNSGKYFAGICNNNEFWRRRWVKELGIDLPTASKTGQNAINYVHLGKRALLKKRRNLCFLFGASAAFGYRKLVLYLLSKPGLVDIHCDDETALRAAAAHGESKIAEILINNGANVHIKPKSPLILAAQNGHTDTVSVLLKAGVDINVEKGRALRLAAKHQYYDTVSFLIEQGADVNASKGQALINAARKGYVDIARLLLDTGAIRRGYKIDALLEAAKFDKPDIISLLVDNGVNLRVGADEALEIAIKHGNIKIVQFVLDRLDDNDLINMSLFLAAAANQLKLAEFLLDEYEIAIDGLHEALLAAAQEGHNQMIELLRNRGADIHFNDDATLIAAAENGRDQTVELLLNNGANVHAQDDEALVVAAEGDHVATVAILLARGANKKSLEDMEISDEIRELLEKTI